MIMDMDIDTTIDMGHFLDMVTIGLNLMLGWSLSNAGG